MPLYEDAASDVIEKTKGDHKIIIEKFSAKSLSLRVDVNDIFLKIILLYAGSYYEYRITTIVKNAYAEHCTGDCNESHILAEFVNNQGLNRQYHRLFAWKEKNANKFFGLFGSAFKKWMVDKVESDPKLEASIKAFMELGQLRNKAVHENLAVYSVGKTVDEVFHLYEQAAYFVEKLPTEIRAFANRASVEPDAPS